MVPTSNVPTLELERVRGLRKAWQQEWTERADVDLGRLLTSLQPRLEEAIAAHDVPGKPEEGFSRIDIRLEIPVEPHALDRPLELLQSLHWNGEIIERAIETLVLECRRRRYSWADIAAALDVARQSAWTKYAALEGDASAGSD